MSPIAVIDIGTLKVKTEIATVNTNGTLNSIYKSNNLTCFGVGMDKNNDNAQEQYIQSTIDELKRIKKILQDHQVIHCTVISTHAMRKAKNQQEVLTRIKTETNFDVLNITQDEEAELFFRAVMQTFQSPQHDYCIMDIGGSVQILIGTKNNLHTKLLLPTGTVSLHERFITDPHNPESMTTQENIEQMKQYILEQVLLKHFPQNIPIIYGSSMIIDVIKILGIHLDKHTHSITHPYQTYATYLEQFLSQIITYPSGHRDSLYPTLPHGYGWGIDKAFLNILTFTQLLHSPYIIPSNANIAQGFIYQLAFQS